MFDTESGRSFTFMEKMDTVTEVEKLFIHCEASSKDETATLTFPDELLANVMD